MSANMGDSMQFKPLEGNVLYFSSAFITTHDVPDEIALAISLSGCPLHCKGCHSAFTWDPKFGEELTNNKFTSLLDRNKYAFGMEYRHNPIGRNYAERMFWRVGCNIADSYVTKITKPDYMVSLGFGFPLRNAGTVFNATIEYGHRGPAASLEENYIRFTINAAICENWFFKRRL